MARHGVGLLVVAAACAIGVTLASDHVSGGATLFGAVMCCSGPPTGRA